MAGAGRGPFGGRVVIEVRRPAHPDYPPPAFVDGVYLMEVEARAEASEEHNAIVEGEGGHVPGYLHELILGDVPALVSEIRHLRALLGWDA